MEFTTYKECFVWYFCLLASRVPKILKHIEMLCRTLLWMGSDKQSRKAPISWQIVCMGVIDLQKWSAANSLKLLWNICVKADKLRIKNGYFFKGGEVMEAILKK